MPHRHDKNAKAIKTHNLSIGLSDELACFRDMKALTPFQSIFFKMFVGSAALHGIDRTSVRSVLTGSTGSIFGVLGSAALIILCFILFIGPVMNYFEGDYVQSSFLTLKTQDIKKYSGCDFKMAITFINRETNKIADHNTLRNLIDAKVAYHSPTGSIYETSVEECSPEYFQGMEDPPHQFNSNECFRVPDKLGYLSEMLGAYVAVFGFTFQRRCADPFFCSNNPLILNNDTAQAISFFQDYYYEMYFTSNNVNSLGKNSSKWYKIYSSQYQGHNTITPTTYAIQNTERFYMDDSIMPWINNNTFLTTRWLGHVNGVEAGEDQLLNWGIYSFITTNDLQHVVFRNYKKLDWLLGMLGGGFFLLYLFFWLPCNHISTTKQKIEACQALILSYNKEDEDVEGEGEVKKPEFRIGWHLLNWLPFSLPCFKRQQKFVHQSQKMLDIVQLIKKMKVSMRNLKKTNKYFKFYPKKLVQAPSTNTEGTPPLQQYQQTFQLSTKTIQLLEGHSAIPRIYQTNPTMLLLNKSEQSMRIFNENSDIYKISDEHRESSVKGCLKKLKKYITKALLFCDVFGAKPMLSATPKNYSAVGCLITLLIITLSVLTFALTLQNMSVTKIYMDEIFVAPEDMHVDMISGDDFKMAICFNQLAFDNNLVISQDRVADISFYQYERNGSQQNIVYYPALWTRVNLSPYFDISSQSFDFGDLTYCFRPDNDINFTVEGSDKTDQQKYFGVTLKPFCSGTSEYCQSVENQTKAAFLDLISIYPMSILLPQNKYYPEEGRIVTNPFPFSLSQTTHYYNIQLSQSVEETAEMYTLQLIDDRESWVVGQTPPPSEQTLSANFQQMILSTQTVPSADPYYRLKIVANGSTERIHFTNYKIDFLFATIGGCFMFFFIIFGCCGRCFNHYRLRSHLANMLYLEDETKTSFFRRLCRCLNFPLCSDALMKKISNDLNAINLVQSVENCYHLSTAPYLTFQQKNLALIYLKERIKQDEKVVAGEEELSDSDDDQTIEDGDDDDFFPALEEDLERREKSRNLLGGSRGVRPVPEQIQSYDASMEKISKQWEQKLYIQQEQPDYIPNRSRSKLSSAIDYLDLFKSQSELTLDGKRVVRSVCGGICCILMLVFIIILLQHYLYVYFLDKYIISSQKVMDQDNQNRTAIEFNVGEDFALAVSFFKVSDYDFLDVSADIQDVGLDLVKYQIRRSGNNLATSKQEIPLVSCPNNYFDDFQSEYSDRDYYENLTRAYCVPKDTKLSLKGDPNSETREYFSILIHNKYGENSTFGMERVQYFLQNYLIRYHISLPMKDYNTSQIQYQTATVIKHLFYQSVTSVKTNITIQKTQILYDTAINPSNEFPTIHTYDVNFFSYTEYQTASIDENQHSNQMYFALEDFVNVNTVKKIKVNEMFGLVGGAILFVFFGLGVFAKSFNEYKMRYIIGSKLYIFLGRMKKRSRRYQDQLADEPNNLSEIKILFAWVLSFWAYLIDNYNFRTTLRMVSLIDYRVGKDLNLFQFYKNLQSCQLSIKKMNQTGKQTLDITKIYPKKMQNNTISARRIKIENKDLKVAHMYNRFTDRELAFILQAEEKEVDIEGIFEEKWLDKFFKVQKRTGGKATTQQKLINSSNQPSEMRQIDDIQMEGTSQRIQRKKGQQQSMINSSVNRSDALINFDGSQIDQKDQNLYEIQ